MKRSMCKKMGLWILSSEKNPLALLGTRKAYLKHKTDLGFKI